jgi:2,4-dienoyl-CoA reductase (NADPH2)
VPFADGYQIPDELSAHDLEMVKQQFVKAAERALQAGFRIIELHAAHGYLLHEFLSPISNRRTDDFGGSLENRMRFPLQVARALRSALPASMPLFVRISATDYAEDGNGWDVDQSVEFSKQLKEIGVDLIDCSSGGTLPHAKIPAAPGYQVPFAATIREQTGIMTGAVGLITEPEQANAIVEKQQADVVLLGRELLRDPYWTLHAAGTLGCRVPMPPQYHRAMKT